MKIRTTTFADATRLSGVSEEELRAAFKDGLIMARRLENTGVYHIDEGELERYLRLSRNRDLSERAPLRRILIVEDDVRFAESIRLDVERDATLGARAVTWGKDAVGLLHTYKPHLCLLGWRAPDDQMRLVVEVLGMRGVQRQTRMLAYGGNTTRVEKAPEPDVLLKSLGIASLYSKALGLRELVGQCYLKLGLEPVTGLSRKRQPGSLSSRSRPVAKL
jgi:hypothetical protein